MEEDIKKKIITLIVGTLVFAAGLIIPLFAPISENMKLILFLAAYLIMGRSVIKEMAENLAEGEFLDENFLMVVATAGAFLVGNYAEGAAVMLFFEIGELFERLAVDRSRASIVGLMDIRPDLARVRRDGEYIEVKPSEVHIGDRIRIEPGERVPLDGVILSGNGSIDTTQLTGESMPRDAAPGDTLLSGSVVMNGVLEVRVEKEFGDSTASRILEMVENAGSRKAESEKFITRFAHYYTPIVVGCAAAVAIIPSLLTGDWHTWVYRGLTFLVISCPCALVISIPLSFFGGLGAASRQGILVKGSNYLEALTKLDTIVFDKTGTLTKGGFSVSEIISERLPKEKLLEYAAYAESFSPHPISVSLRKAFNKEIDKERVSSYEEIPGRGIHAYIEFSGEPRREIFAGNALLMKEQGQEIPKEERPGTPIFIMVNGHYEGYVLISDTIKEEAPDAIQSLKESGTKRFVMLTGDNRISAKAVADRLGMTGWYAELLPGDKVAKVEELLAEDGREGKLAFVGDGMNDAPVLARADVGVAMGALGCDAAIEAADVVIMDDSLSKLNLAVRIARKTLRITKENISFSITVKIAVLVLAALGFADMWAAVFADVGVMILAVLNSVRTLRIRP